MPIGRYFFCVGSVLLALLFLADWYYPSNASPSHAELDRSILRIKSDHKWPERIVFDMSLPTIVPPPVLAQDIPRAHDPREAFAKVAPILPAAALPSPARDFRPAPPRKSKVVRRPTAYPSSGFQQANAREAPFSW
jgi:hypothetical protein